jgi:tRNA-2-methylthio-N6-dimethylallyladenosine synthase
MQKYKKRKSLCIFAAILMPKMKYYVITLGCQMNRADSERLSSVVEKMGYIHTTVEEEADLLGVIACSVRQKPIDKVYNKAVQWNRWKAHRRVLTFLTGCVLPADREKLLRQFDLIFPMNELTMLPDMLQQYGIVGKIQWQQIETQTSEDIRLITKMPGISEKSRILLSQDITPVVTEEVKTSRTKTIEQINGLWKIEPQYQSNIEAFIPIQNGCNKFCTYCAVPFTRGREISRESWQILDEFKRLVEADYKSITLLGQNVNSYGLDKKGREINFAELLSRVGEAGKASGKELRIYFTSPHPQDMTREVIDVIRQYDCISKQIHLPLQSGDNGVLQRMNRKYTVEKYAETVACIRELLPTATLFTDIIVGFTGETAIEFEKTIAAFHTFRFNMAYIAIYSPRPGAASYKWADDVPNQIKRERLHELSEVMRIYTREYNHKQIGCCHRVLFNGTDRKTGYSAGLTEGLINVRINQTRPDLTGKIADVTISSATDLSLEGELVQ